MTAIPRPAPLCRSAAAIMICLVLTIFANLFPAACTSAQERTFLAVKPDGVQRRLVGEILRRFERKGFKLVALKLVQASEQLLREHYAELRERPFYGRLVKYMSSGPVVAMVWQGLDVVRASQALIGTPDPADALPGTIRGDFCVEERDPRQRLGGKCPPGDRAVVQRRGAAVQGGQRGRLAVVRFCRSVPSSSLQPPGRRLSAAGPGAQAPGAQGVGWEAGSACPAGYQATGLVCSGRCRWLNVAIYNKRADCAALVVSRDRRGVVLGHLLHGAGVWVHLQGPKPEERSPGPFPQLHPPPQPKPLHDPVGHEGLDIHHSGEVAGGGEKPAAAPGPAPQDLCFSGEGHGQQGLGCLAQCLPEQEGSLGRWGSRPARPSTREGGCSSPRLEPGQACPPFARLCLAVESFRQQAALGT
ncbi:nucleoside diphosphate kinase 3 isoform X1 [Tupaia chinensis]|uniref:nucleoside diphosphate kinase 3 isoform X1 n=1 Tax=Tupaia chinensis TaxID=246437 RepID=UPI000704301F|nr:nucleoside diphosphate kinase 3 isoform X1 [Tupaia chinensis]